MLNVGLGFGLAMYYGYGPPGLEGILQAVGPMPPAAPDAATVAAKLGEPYAPAISPNVSETALQSAASLSAAVTGDVLAEPSIEDRILGGVREMATNVQTAMVSDAAQPQ